MTVAEALNDAARRLATVSDTARLDAELLMAHALRVSREALLLGRRDGESPTAFDALVARRHAHEPVAYIIGRREFWTIDLMVGPGVLIPRPDSETLIEAALAYFGPKGPAKVLDMGTGSGALLLAALAEWPEAVGVGVDVSDAALATARTNAERLGMADRAMIARGGWDAAAGGAYDLILCNPPYIAEGETLPPDVADFEPAMALYAGADGLDDYRRIAPALRLPAGGIACIEIGSGQARAVRAIFEAAGFVTQVRTDLSGHDRCIIVLP